MSECIWVSKALSGSINHAGFLTDLFDPNDKNDQTPFDYDRKNRFGESLSVECFPKKAWLLPEDAHRKKRPDFGVTGSFAFMSEKCAEVFRRFDLGGGNLYPLEFFEADKITRLPGNWFCINFGNVKSCFLPEQSIKCYPVPGKKFSPKPTFADDDLAFHSNALNGPDVWIDPLLSLTFCMSDHLVTALRDVGLLEAFDPVRRGKIVR